MPSIDPWPLTPVLAQLPAVARLNRDFEAERLRSDLDATDGRWADIKIMTGAGVGAPITDNDWRSIPLRSIGGDLGRTDPGGPDLIGFADTPLLDRMPNLQAVLSAIPGEIRSVRLMALGPGVSSPLHSDTKLGLPWGLVRLHVPIVTDP